MTKKDALSLANIHGKLSAINQSDTDPVRPIRTTVEQKYPEPTVGALVVDQDSRALLVKSYKWFQKFTIPGGHVEVGETMKEALKREVREEVGLDVEVVDLQLVQEAIFTPEFWKKKHFIFFDYLCRINKQNVMIDNDEVQDYVWVRPRDGLNLELDSFTRRVLQKYLKVNPADQVV